MGAQKIHPSAADGDVELEYEPWGEGATVPMVRVSLARGTSIRFLPETRFLKITI